MPKKERFRKLTLKGQKRKRDLLDSALRLFTAKGYRATSMDDIAHDNGTGKGTVYWYWRSKEDIFLELLDEKLGAYLTALERVAGMQVDPRDKLPLMVAEIGTVFVKYRSLCRLLFLLITEDSDAFKGEVKAKTAGYYHRFHELIASILKEAAESGKSDGNDDASMLAALIIAMLDGIVFQEMLLQKEYSLGKLGAVILKLLKQGI